MKRFNDLEFKEHSHHYMGIQSHMDFHNGWGVSVVKSAYTYGGDKGLYELAVFKDGHIHYDNPISKGNVVGCLRPEDISDVMKIIQKW